MPGPDRPAAASRACRSDELPGRLLAERVDSTRCPRDARIAVRRLVEPVVDTEDVAVPVAVGRDHRVRRACAR